jgi:hypothetical protein
MSADARENENCLASRRPAGENKLPKQNRPPAFADGRRCRRQAGWGALSLRLLWLTPGADRPGAGSGAGDAAP